MFLAATTFGGRCPWMPLVATNLSVCCMVCFKMTSWELLQNKLVLLTRELHVCPCQRHFQRSYQCVCVTRPVCLCNTTNSAAHVISNQHALIVMHFFLVKAWVDAKCKLHLFMLNHDAGTSGCCLAKLSVVSHSKAANIEPDISATLSGLCFRRGGIT